jgi:hypothetical protein
MVISLIIILHNDSLDVSVQMWEYKHSIEGKVSRSAVWSVYSDVATWPQWVRGIEWIRLDGGFEMGVSGTVKPKGQNQQPFRLTKVSIDSGFSDKTEIPGAGVTIGFTHTLEPTAEGVTRITHHVAIWGSTAEYLGPAIGQKMADGIPDTMYALLRMAQQREG